MNEHQASILPEHPRLLKNRLKFWVDRIIESRSTFRCAWCINNRYLCFSWIIMLALRKNAFFFRAIKRCTRVVSGSGLRLRFVLRPSSYRCLWLKTLFQWKLKSENLFNLKAKYAVLGVFSIKGLWKCYSGVGFGFVTLFTRSTRPHNRRMSYCLLKTGWNFLRTQVKQSLYSRLIHL